IVVDADGLGKERTLGFHKFERAAGRPLVAVSGVIRIYIVSDDGIVGVYSMRECAPVIVRRVECGDGAVGGAEESLYRARIGLVVAGNAAGGIDSRDLRHERVLRIERGHLAMT